MRNSIEKTGKTVDQAIEDALNELRIAPEDAVIEVLDEGESGGLLGFGRREARVRVTVASLVMEDGFDPSNSLEETDSDQVADTEWSESENEGLDSFAEKDQELDFEIGGGADANYNSRENNRRRNGNGRDRGYRNRRHSEERPSEPRRSQPEETEERIPLTEERRNEAEEVGCDFVAGVLQNLDIHGRISSYYDAEDALHIEVTGEGIGNAIGRRGETLDALRTLTSLAVNHHQEAYVRVLLDIGHYREKRVKSLQSKAHRDAVWVVRNGRRTVMEPMSAQDRRIVHMSLVDFRGVVTYSEGSEPNRCVVIAPDDSRRS